MAGRSSNRERIARAALEAEAAAKQASSARKAPSKSTGRTRVVWLLCDPSGRSIKTYLYPDEERARADAAELTAETGKTHFVSRGEVPFA